MSPSKSLVVRVEGHFPFAAWTGHHAASKVAAFGAAGIPVATAPSEIPALVKQALAAR